MPRHADAGTGIAELISIFPVSEFGIVSIFVCNRTVVDLFITAVADIRSLVQTFTTFFLEIPAGLVTGRTGSAFDPAQDDLVAGIGLFAVVSVNTKVMGIVKRAFMIPVGYPVSFDLFRDGCGIFTEKACNVFERLSGIQLLCDILAVFKCKMFLVSGYIFTHKEPPSTAVRRGCCKS
jgi:hypothetical protein